MRSSRILALVVAAGLVAAVAFAFLSALDVDQYRDDLAVFVEARTGRSFSVDGDIRFSLALVPTVSLERVRLGNPAWAQPGDLISIERVEAKLAPGGLLHAQLKVSELHLHGVVLNLETRHDGRGNWLFEPQAVTEPAARYWQPDYDLESVHLSQMIVRLQRDAGAPRRLDIRSLELTPQGPDGMLGIDLGATFNGLDLHAQGSMSRLQHLLGDAPSALALEGRFGALKFALTGSTAMPSRAAVETLEFSVTAPDLAALGAPFELEFAGDKPVAITGSLGREDKSYRLEPLDIRIGSSELRAELVVDATTLRVRIAGEIAAPHLDTADFAAAGEPAPDDERVFPDTQLPFDLVPRVDADVRFTSATLITRSLVFNNLASRIKLADGNAVVGPAQATVADGEFLARLDIHADGETPEVAAELSLSGVRLDQLTQPAVQGSIDGGALDVNVNLTGRGRSVREIMAHANGTIAVDIGAATIDNTLVNLAEADLLLSFLTRLNPFAARDPVTAIECVAVRLPVTDGVAENAAGIGILTRNLSILAGGSLNFANERIDLGARPKPREGVGLSVSGLVDFLRLGGTLKHPQAVTDTRGVATAGIKVGAAVATAGLSVVAEGLFDRASADSGVCGVVRDSLRPRAAKRTGGSVIDATASKAKSAVQGAGEAIRNVFDGLFGN